MNDKRSNGSPRRRATPSHAAAAAAKPLRRGRAPRDLAPPRPASAEPPWMKLDEPHCRTLKVYALDPSAGNYVGNVMSLRIGWERNLKKGPIGRRFAVIDYDAANKCYYPPVDLDDYRILARGGLDPSEADPRFHQQMVYAVATETLEKFEAALGRSIHWRRAERLAASGRKDADAERADDIWVLKLYPHAMVQPNAFYSREAHGILFGYFRASESKPGNNLPGQCVFTCLSHDIIAHEVTHAVIDGIRTYFTEATNPDVLAFHEAFADLTALFLHFSQKEALLDTIRKTGGRLYPFELRPDAAPVESGASPDGEDEVSPISGMMRTRNPLIELAQQFGQASGMGRGLRSALDKRPDPKALAARTGDPHLRGSILVAAVFDAYFSTYLRVSADLFRIFRAGGGRMDSTTELPPSLANLLAETASRTADEFFQLCARALDYCPPVDITFGDFLRALITASADLRPDDDRGVRQALMQAFRVRGIYPDRAGFFSDDALRWARVPAWSRSPVPEALPPVVVELRDPATNVAEKHELEFGSALGLTKAQKDLNGAILRKYASDNAERLGFAADPDNPPEAPSFHPVFRVGANGRLQVDMVIELVQTRRVPFEPEFPQAGTFPMRGGVTLIVAAPDRDATGHHVPPTVRFAIGKRLTGEEGEAREASQRSYHLAMGLMNGDTREDRHFQADFGLVHQGM